MSFRSSVLLLVLAGCFADPKNYDEIAIEKYREANELFAKGRYAECVERYEYVVQWRERILDAHLKLATCYERTGRPDDAVPVLERLVRIDRQNVEGMRRLAAAYAERKRIDEAIELNRRILERNPGDERARAELSRLEKLK